jgi:hemoglobin
MNQKSLYERLGNTEDITAFVDELLPRLRGDSHLGRFYQYRGEDGIAKERQLTIDFLCSSAGGPDAYTGRDMKTAHRGMKISDSDWAVFLGLIGDSLEALQIPEQEYDDVIGFVSSLKQDIIES